ncbi:hypothetical protein [Arenimonas oryziterrae]|uniref:Uncharacterized protein n=1 Tax=Arenimonas oryziterrae DSM 21050 = YC6267 TaxID=1121015 RepID=A0A091B100_9GAMM|nr:hypothetical protein [Arenimonas oryziterrae]KFN44529.1 hypothetical protein N789_00550 [Arenimonas oryziterrae DSM 21050 = YC6267]
MATSMRARRWSAAWLLLCLAGFAAAVVPAAPTQMTPEADRRGEDQTFLTYPEWFLVYSPDEFADFLKAGKNPSEFPFIGHLQQFWQAYGAIYRITGDRYDFNGEYHTMIGVIGVSTTLEYGLKSAYETVVGRVTELTAGGTATEEDRLAAEVARDYVDFLALQPWYEYDFSARLKQVWTDTPWVGPNMLRKWERKYWLTSEYAGKAIYGWLIGKATRSSFEKPKLETVAWVDGFPAESTGLPSDLRVIRREADGHALIALPRYAPFTTESLQLAQRGVRFEEIAGNRDAILITVIAPGDWRAPDRWPYRVLFLQPVLTRANQQRLAVVVPVKDLDRALLELAQAPYRLEHVYDY